ncbi:MAG TPA: PAS domain-containing protein [Woeseiaceae bacterium]|nr:PAS domain-containing protein [Woeseiaceae bacterium]
MLIELAVNVLASAILLLVGFISGKHRERKLQRGINLEEYEFYPFGLDDNRHLYFDKTKFNLAVRHFLKSHDAVAARQLILVGQQNDVDNLLSVEERSRFRRLYTKYDGDRIRNDTAEFLNNFKRIVRLVGDSFPDTGIEILLHDLTNPAKALSFIKNNVTGRDIESPATNLVLDLKMRREQKQDKLNYELNIGARKFKCTTIPIYRDGYGLVGAICINVDVNYLNEDVRRSNENLDRFFRSLCKTEMKLGENILSKDEYEKAMRGKRHFRDIEPAAAS